MKRQTISQRISSTNGNWTSKTRVFTFLTLILLSCQDELQRKENNPNGLPPETIELKDYYLVEGDILIPKFGISKNGRITQASTNSLVTYSLQPSIKVYFALPDDWDVEIQNALNDWTLITNCRISFSRVSLSSNADIVIQSDNGILLSNTIAAASWPNNGLAGNVININLDFNNGSISAGQKRYNMVHELGHCIGLRHTNWASRGEDADPLGANTISGTPTSDPNSVMNGGTANFSWNGFSLNDILAVQTLYSQSNEIVNGIISPNGGESFSGQTIGGGSAIFTLQISLNSAVFNPSRVAVDVLQNDKVFYYGIYNVVSGKVTFTSAFPGGGGSIYKVKVTDVDNPNNFDFSNSSFSIFPRR